MKSHRVIFYLVPQFSMIAFSCAIEPLRLANRYADADLYNWTLVTADGGPAVASNDLAFQVDQSLDEVRTDTATGPLPDYIIVCAGLNTAKYRNPKLNGWLRAMSRRGVKLGGLCTAANLLAQAELLEGKNCAIHWESLPGFAERYPDTNVHANLFEIDDNIYTSAGGTAALDMMLHIIGDHHGEQLQAKVCEGALTDRVRNPRDRQRLPLRARLGVFNTKLLMIIELMEANIAEPLTLSELSRYAGLSRRHIERLFQSNLGRSPARYYLEIRLERARNLLIQSSMPVVEVAVACGFVSASHFSKCFREMYGRSPQMERVQVATG